MSRRGNGMRMLMIMALVAMLILISDMQLTKCGVEACQLGWTGANCSTPYCELPCGKYGYCAGGSAGCKCVGLYSGPSCRYIIVKSPTFIPNNTECDNLKVFEDATLLVQDKLTVLQDAFVAGTVKPSSDSFALRLNVSGTLNLTATGLISATACSTFALISPYPTYASYGGSSSDVLCDCHKYTS